MSQCVPSWDINNNHNKNNNNRISRRSRSNIMSPDVTMLDYQEVAELTWENGHIAMHSLAASPRVPAKTAVVEAAAATATTNSAIKYTWEKPRASGTLESIVNQATSLPNCNPPLDGRGGGGCGGGGGVGNELAPWFDQQRAAAAAAAAAAATATVTMAMDALVPCSNRTSKDTPPHVIETVMGQGIGLGGGGGGDGRTCVVDCSTLVGSCSGPPAATKEVNMIGKRAKAARGTVAPECSGRDQSASGSATCGRTHDTYNTDMADLGGLGFTSTSMGSPENTSSANPCTKDTNTANDHDSVSHYRPQREAGDEGDKKKGTGKSSVSTKRSRAAAIHNQSERKRRDKINQRMKTLQKLVPNSSKTDKASMLDEVIEYLKQLQAQIQMMSRMNIPQMMMPMTMQQQLQMSMMAPMGMGMGMGMGVMDMMNAIARPNIPAVSPVITPPFMPVAASWDGSGSDRLQAPPATVLADPLSFLACQSQPMTMDAYSRMASLYQQLQQPSPPASSSKS